MDYTFLTGLYFVLLGALLGIQADVQYFGGQLQRSKGTSRWAIVYSGAGVIFLIASIFV